MKVDVYKGNLLVASIEMTITDTVDTLLSRLYPFLVKNTPHDTKTTIQLYWTSKLLDINKKWSEYIGTNEKTKIKVFIGLNGQFPEERITDSYSYMMAYYREKQDFYDNESNMTTTYECHNTIGLK